ncbi:hypothetical protein K470DRAFT_258229 [Piedraia hortae CBS 480.64]|uniref:Uncharacterized protein n=1 Tax=Piedraia hortae CBS 480.64 TaxID=1314780 RepID=A0A6A7BYB1_9PEZI|nr:hypothetical protein K470DRAFT_258229 [Piedraia hortae CBS 480.64]
MATVSEQLPSALTRWVPSIPNISLGMFNPFGLTPAEESGKWPSSDVLSGTFDPASSSPPRSVASGMFSEPEVHSNVGSNESEGSIRRKTSRPKTKYSICHPPPTTTTRKLHRRQRAMLQLHKLSAATRPEPAFEVVPGVNFSVRLNKALAKVIRTRHTLSPNDLIVIRAERYRKTVEVADGDEPQVLGLICKIKKDETPKLCMADGQEWEVHSMTGGGYEFTKTDAHGLILRMRWVPKKTKDSATKQERRFTFSPIAPNTRKHPIVARLSQAYLEIYDNYKHPDPAAMTPLSTPKKGTNYEDDEEETPTNDALREMIIMTGIWVTFREGWSSVVRLDEQRGESALAGSGIQRSGSVLSAGSLGPSPSKSTPGSPLPGGTMVEKRASIRSTGSNNNNRRRLSGVFTPTASNNRNSTLSVSTAHADETGVFAGDGRSRGDSTSTVLIARSASVRRSQGSWLMSRQQPLNEASREDLGKASEAAPPHGTESKEHTPATSGKSSESSSRGEPAPNTTAARPQLPDEGQNWTAVSNENGRRRGKLKWRRMLLCSKQ